MKTWQKGFLAILAVLAIGVIAFGLYLVFNTEASYPKPIPSNVNRSSPTQRPMNNPLPPCDKPTVSTWMDKLEARQNEHNKDLDIILITQSPNPDDYISLANRAKSRYNAQRLEQTPECLSSLQTLMTDAFYYHWQGLVAITRGNWNEGASNMEITTEKLEIAEAAINAAIELAE